MIDKAEQRRRAAEMSQTLAAQGQQAPKLTYPVKPQPSPSKIMQQLKALAEAEQAKQKPVSVKLDCAGKELKVGDTVATTVDGIVSVLQVGTISRMVGDRVEVKVKMNRAKPGCTPMWHEILKAPSAVAKIEK